MDLVFARTWKRYVLVDLTLEKFGLLLNTSVDSQVNIFFRHKLHKIYFNEQVQRRLGYCPQFDATIDEMTGRETLRMFANLRGVPERSIDAVVEDLTDKLLLREHIEKQVKELRLVVILHR